MIFSQDEGDVLRTRAAHASHRARILGLGLSVGIAIAVAGCVPEPEQTFRQCFDTGPALDTQRKLEAKVSACVQVAGLLDAQEDAQ